jgi:hypothetical protein
MEIPEFNALMTGRCKLGIDGEKMNRRIGVKKVLIGLLVSLTTGCVQPHPNVRLFADKTTEMVKAIEVGNKSVETLLNQNFEERQSSTAVDRQKRSDIELQRQLQKRLGHVQASLRAVIGYSSSLADVADTAKNSGNNFDSVVESLKTLRRSVEPILPLPSAPEMAVVALREFNERIENIKASRTISLAVANADPEVQYIAQGFIKYLSELKSDTDSNAETIKSEFQFKNKAQITYRNTLVQRDREAMQHINSIGEYRNSNDPKDRAEKLLDLRKLDSALSDEPTMEYLDKMERNIISAASLYRAELVRIEPMYREIKANENTLNQQIDEARLFLQGAQTLISAWAKTHSSLKVAIEQKQKINLLELTNAVQDVLNIIQAREK